MSKTVKTQIQAPLLGADQIALLERLSNAVAVSGDEGEVRAMVAKEVKPFADDIQVDALGNLLVTRKAKTPNPMRIMVDAHMDEIGFMILEDQEGGLYEFAAVGGIDERILPGKVLLVGKDHLPGVIGACPIHLTGRDEMARPISIKSLKIDIGIEGAGKVKVGERATFATRFRQDGSNLWGKALDDRLGVATLIELVKNPPENVELLAAFTVQEEVGLRGARVAAYAFNPDAAFVIDSTPAVDMPMWDETENTQYNCKLDAGPAIYMVDSGTLSDPRLIRHLVETAEANHIPYQFRQPGGGGTDGGTIHRVRAGVPTVSISVPGRYAHMPIMLARLEDWQHTYSLIYCALAALTPSVLDQER